MLTVVIGGLGVLVALAALIGIALDREARNSAWARIAAARRTVAEQTRELEQRELAVVVRAAELDAREQALVRREAALERRKGERYDKPPEIPA
jgi:hypothetical protein